MKLIMAIVSSDDAQNVIKSLTHEGFLITKLATTGGFLMAGNVTIMTGVDDERVDDAINIIREKSKSRSQTVPTISESSIGGFMNAPLVEVTIGGATIFVLPIERFEKI
ncbi:MAG: cyclic-di-AMP receptor [Oscillospiraceae bacterium]|nr:cyclic-di-AMP receptor [Oscillospiraceae bacterium]